MPLLEKEPSLAPEDLLQRDPPSGDRSWWAARTKSRQEKAIARWLRREGIPYYLPQYERTWRSSGKRRRAWLPLFPGYVFFVGDNEERYESLVTGYLAQTIEVEDQEEFLRDLRRIRAAEVSARPLEVLSDWFEPGKLVVVGRGPMKGIEGVVERRKGKTRLVIRVNFLSQAVAVELDPADLDPA